MQLRAVGAQVKVHPPPLHVKSQVAASWHSMLQLPPEQVKSQLAPSSQI